MTKTIFVDLFAINAARNLIMPDGVVDLLTRPGDMRVVLLIPNLPEFEALVSPYSSRPHVVVEKISKTFPETFLEKAFQFFYSYLVFTPTTALLATFGARADAPPAGGNRHLWIVKAFIANTFGRFKLLKRKIVPAIYMRIFHTRPYSYLFSKYHPQLVFLPNVAFNPGIELTAESKRQKVRTVAMPANWDHLNKYYIPTHADFLLVQNEPMMREAIDYHAYRKEQIVPVGFPQFDDYTRRAYVRPREEFFEKFGFNKDERFILYISGSVYAMDEADILAELYAWIKAGKFGPGVRLMVRPYVGLREIELEKKKYEKLMQKPDIIFNWRTNDENSENKKDFTSMLYYSSLIISVFSTTAIEAALFDKPIITLGFDGYSKQPYHKSIARLERLSHFKHVLDTGSVRVARSFRELEELASLYLKNPELDKDKREILTKKMCYMADGHASERIAEFILNKAK